MRSSLWRFVVRRLARAVPAERVGAVLFELEEDYASRLRQSNPIWAAAWLLREARSIEKAYRNLGTADPGRSGWFQLASPLDAVGDALRLLRWHRGYVAFAAMTLAVAVGVNLVVFTIVNALWLRPMPISDIDHVVAVGGMRFVRTSAPVLQGLGAEVIAGQVDPAGSVAGAEHQLALAAVGQEVETLGVTPEYFSLLGQTVRGRGFTPEDDQPGAPPVAIISDRLWSGAFDRRQDAIGSIADARPFPVRVIGVAPPHFEGARRGEHVDVWVPSRLLPRLAAANGASPNNYAALIGLARLRPGDSAADVTHRIKRQFGRDVDGIEILPLRDVFGAPQSAMVLIREGAAVWVVAGLALLVLFGGCATLMAMVLVHYERRKRELAVRLALGSTRITLIAMLTREMALLALLGIVGAVLVCVWALEVIPALSLPGGVDLARLDLSVDWRVLAVAIGATTLTLLIATSIPLSRFTRGRLAGELLSGPWATPSASSQRVRQVLLAVHVSATIVVLVAAGLFVRAIGHAFGHAPGFDVQETMFAAIPLPRVQQSGGGAEAIDAWLGSVDERTKRLADLIRAVPGVSAVTLGRPPIGPDAERLFREPILVRTRSVERKAHIATVWGSVGWLDGLGVPIVTGRGLTPADIGVPSPVPAVVTEAVARLLWPSENPLGQVLSLGSRTAEVQVVGVARDFVFGSLSQPAFGVASVAGRSPFGPQPQFVIRSTDPAALVEPIRHAVTRTNPAGRVRIVTGTNLLVADLGRQRLGAWFFSGFALTALLLGVAGVFGLVAYVAESRQREFGVRVALGAAPTDLIRHGLAAGLLPVSLGVAAGLMAAGVVSQLFTSLLAGLSALDPIIYVLVAITMLGCAGIASFSAALRLRRIEPSRSLRSG